MLAHWPLLVVVGLVIRYGIAAGFGLLAFFGPEPKATYEVEIKRVFSIRIRPREACISKDFSASLGGQEDAPSGDRSEDREGPAGQHGD